MSNRRRPHQPDTIPPVLTLDGAQLQITHGATVISLPYAQAAWGGLMSLVWLRHFMQSIGARRVCSAMPRRLLRDAVYGPTAARKKVRKLEKAA